MGFATGLIGGFTLTSSLIYLSLAIHQRNRLQQAAVLRQQSLILTNIVEPIPAPPAPTARETCTGLAEMAKDRWNSELEGLVRRVQTTDWHAVRQDVEERLASLWRKETRHLADDIRKPGALNTGVLSEDER